MKAAFPPSSITSRTISFTPTSPATFRARLSAWIANFDSSPGLVSFDLHTHWVSKDKAGRPVKLGVSVCVREKQHGFLLHRLILREPGTRTSPCR